MDEPAEVPVEPQIIEVVIESDAEPDVVGLSIRHPSLVSDDWSWLGSDPLLSCLTEESGAVQEVADGQRIVHVDGVNLHLMWLVVSGQKHMEWGYHPGSVLKRRGCQRQIQCGEFLFDCLVAASITGPDGRDEHLSMAQWKHMVAVNVLTPELANRARGQAVSAFIAPRFRDVTGVWEESLDVFTG